LQNDTNLLAQGILGQFRQVLTVDQARKILRPGT
jgi:hypothetical protein